MISRFAILRENHNLAPVALHPFSFVYGPSLRYHIVACILLEPRDSSCCKTETKMGFPRGKKAARFYNKPRAVHRWKLRILTWTGLDTYIHTANIKMHQQKKIRISWIQRGGGRESPAVLSLYDRVSAAEERCFLLFLDIAEICAIFGPHIEWTDAGICWFLIEGEKTLFSYAIYRPSSGWIILWWCACCTGGDMLIRLPYFIMLRLLVTSVCNWCVRWQCAFCFKCLIYKINYWDSKLFCK